LTLSPSVSSACRRKKYGSVPLVAATFLPLRSATDVMSLSGPTTMADHSGCEYTSMTLIGEPFARARSAAEPAVEPTSRAPARRSSFALFDPADWVHSTSTSSPRAFSMSPWSFTTRLSGL